MSYRLPDVGSFLVMGFHGTDLSAETMRCLREIRPGGVVLFLRNVESSRQLRALTNRLRSELDPSPLVAIDMEGGTVNRFRHLIGELPTIRDLQERGIPATKFGRVIGRLLRTHGVDLDFAPVLDLELFGEDVDNALRGRCWGNTAQTVADQAGAFLDGLQSVGVTGCAKHFPGLGGARLDSHEELPTIERSVQQIIDEDIQPYRVMLPRLNAVMVGHGHYPSLDGSLPIPASLSRRVVTGMLRGDLGFKGLILTDDLEMGAITRRMPVAEAAVNAIEAGADAVLVCHSMDLAMSTHRALSDAVETGRIGASRLRDTRERLERCRGRNT
jgi:beta-N-acetylhexosaminidase